MLTTDKTEFNLPDGEWKHIKKSWQWEQHNENFAKGKIGSFKQAGAYLHWQSLDATTSLFIEVKEIQSSSETLWILHRSGLEYWFRRTYDTKSNSSKTTKKAITGRVTAKSDGR